ncbi:MAG: c-type cytochrome [Magnetococcales bacterium]|nr:c-type cytochrome [Magnetococcales bacterium]
MDSQKNIIIFPGFLQQISAIILFLILLFPGLALAESKANSSDLPKIIYGGKLYDNWLALVPEKRRLRLKNVRKTHPSYPKTSKKRGLSTWRCKECHGWDYKGRDGAYGKGSHYSGIKGVGKFVGGDPKAVVEIIRDSTHKYSKAKIPDEDALALAKFITEGQIKMDLYIDPSTKKAKGVAKRGAPFYQTICATCHGLDGRKINFNINQGHEYVGNVASENPWEALHKIRNGHPGTKMVSMRALTIQQQIDILTFSQTLPVDPSP